jgi:hypothetical protein
MLSQPSSSQTKSESLPSHQEVSRETPKHYIGENLSRKDRTKFLLNTLRDMDDNKEAIYGALDAWVAWEQNFPIGSLRNILLCLEKEQQWHRIVQVRMYHLVVLTAAFSLTNYNCILVYMIHVILIICSMIQLQRQFH